MRIKGRVSETGRSMIEMLGVLAIVGVLTVGAISGYQRVMTKYRINKVVEEFFRCRCGTSLRPGKVKAEGFEEVLNGPAAYDGIIPKDKRRGNEGQKAQAAPL